MRLENLYIRNLLERLWATWPSEAPQSPWWAIIHHLVFDSLFSASIPSSYKMTSQNSVFQRTKSRQENLFKYVVQFSQKTQIFSQIRQNKARQTTWNKWVGAGKGSHQECEGQQLIKKQTKNLLEDNRAGINVCLHKLPLVLASWCLFIPSCYNGWCVREFWIKKKF